MYNGWLIKIGSYIIPNSVIMADTYSTTLVMQDIDDWVDADGYLHRQAVELKALSVEFDTIPMDNASYTSLISKIYGNFTDKNKRECMIEAYIPEQDSYVSQKGYMADTKPTIRSASDNRIMYDPVQFSFVGGVY